VGLIQRAVEAAGIATISVTLSKEITQKVRPPRAVFTNMPMGHPLGFPGEKFRQLQIIRLLLRYLKEIESSGTIVELDLSHTDDPDVNCPICSV